MLVTLLGMVTDVRPVQLWKANSPIYVTEFGMVMDVRLLQPEKAPFLIETTEFGILTDMSFSYPPNAYSPMVVTPSFITICLTDSFEYM